MKTLTVAMERIENIKAAIKSCELAGDDKKVRSLQFTLAEAEESAKAIEELIKGGAVADAHSFLNTLIDEILYSEAVAKLSYKLGNGYPSLEGLDAHNKEMRKVYLASVLMTILEGEKIIKVEVNKKIIDGEWKISKTVLPYKVASALKILTQGANIEPTITKKRIVAKIGAKSIKLPSKLRKQAKKIGEQGFKLIDTPREIFEKYLNLSNTFTKIDFTSKITKNMYKNKLLDGINHLRSRCNFLDVWYDSRLRMYYSLNQLEGVRPQGKLFEVCQWELPIGEVITESGIKHIKHAIVNLLDGRLSLDKANKVFSISHLIRLKRLANSILNATSQDKMGEAMYAERLYIAYSDYVKGRPSKVLIGKDFTSSGPGIAGVSFRSSVLADAANWNGGEEANDLHMMVADALGVKDRTAAKKVNAPIFHGSTYKAAADSINEYLKEDKFTPSDIEKLLVNKFGEAINNIPAIASWGGNSAINKENPSLSWKSLDGLPCQSTAYYEGYEIVMDTYNVFTGKMVQTTIRRDMPVLFDNNGEIYQDKGAYRLLKKRGLFANITHSVDSWMLREIQKAVNFRGIWKHDDFIVHPNDMDKVIDIARRCMLEVYDVNPYLDVMVQIESVVNSGCMPKLYSGDLKEENIEKSVNFLMPE